MAGGIKIEKNSSCNIRYKFDIDGFIGVFYSRDKLGI